MNPHPPPRYAATPRARCNAVPNCPHLWVGILRPIARERGRVGRFVLGEEPPPVHYCVDHVRDAIQKVRNR